MKGIWAMRKPMMRSDLASEAITASKNVPEKIQMPLIFYQRTKIGPMKPWIQKIPLPEFPPQVS